MDKFNGSVIGNYMKLFSSLYLRLKVTVILTLPSPLPLLGFHHHRISVMELSHLSTRSGLTYPEVTSKVYHNSFCKMGISVSLPWVIYLEAFYLHVLSNFSCIPVIFFPKLVLFLTCLQFVHLFCNLSKCILLFFSCISSLLLLFFWRPLL